MLDHPPKERAALSWGYVVLWSALTFVTIPFVRYGVTFVKQRWGSEVFTYVVAACVLLAAVSALYATRRRWSLSSFVWLFGIAGLVIYLTFGLADGNPEEAIHYVQYGVLSLLLFRAFSHRVRDYSIYLAAAIVGTLVGMMDETLQWLVPGRYFDLRDIVLNMKAVVLVQIGIAAGVRPRMISGWPDLVSVRRLCYLSAVMLGYLGLCLQNTPDRIAWYASNVPGLGGIDPDRSIMVEYGYLHGDAANGFFRSRLKVEDLRRASMERADEGRRILDQYRERERYQEFLALYSPLADPFLHEARVHLVRRDSHMRRASNTEQRDRQARYFATAYWENRILQDYFGGVIRGSSYEWSAQNEADVKAAADLSKPYHSAVSKHLIVRFSPMQMALLFAGAVGAFLLGGYACTRALRQRGVG
jgi:hypothetical protein